MGKGKLIRKGAELVGGKKGSSQKPKTKGDNPNAKNGERKAEQPKGNVFSRHPLATGIGAGVVGAGALGAGAYALSGSGDDPAKLSRQDAGSSGGTASSMTDAIFGDGSNPFTGSATGVIEIDPEVLTAFAAELSRLGDAALAAADSAPDAFDMLAERMRRDRLGAPTRSGGPSPVMADMASALEETKTAYIDNARSVAQQLHGDSQRLLQIIENHETVEQDNAQNFNAIDSDV